MFFVSRERLFKKFLDTNRSLNIIHCLNHWAIDINMTDNNKKEPRNHKKKKQSKMHHDDDAYGASRVQKEFKRKKQHLKEEEDWDNWSEYYNQ